MLVLEEGSARTRRSKCGLKKLNRGTIKLTQKIHVLTRNLEAVSNHWFFKDWVSAESYRRDLPIAFDSFWKLSKRLFDSFCKLSEVIDRIR